MTRLGDLAERFATKRDALLLHMRELQSEIKTIKKKYLPLITAAADAARAAREELDAAIKANAANFLKPRTRVFHGLKIGMRKLVGKIGWDDPTKVVSLIKKHLPRKAALLIRTEERPIKEALEQLSAKELKKIGCTVGEDSDVVVIGGAEDDIEKMVTAMLGDVAGSVKK